MPRKGFDITATKVVRKFIGSTKISFINNVIEL